MATYREAIAAQLAAAERVARALRKRLVEIRREIQRLRQARQK